jgi:hypothetical protein
MALDMISMLFTLEIEFKVILASNCLKSNNAQNLLDKHVFPVKLDKLSAT